MFKLEFSPDTTKNTAGFILETKTFSIDIQTNPRFEDGEVGAASDLGTMLSGMNTYTGGSTDYFSYILAILSFDPSGHLMKFSQMNKLLTRFRFLNINFGVLLSAYFKYSANKFDPPSKKSPNWIRDHSDGYYGKFSSENVAIDLFEYKIVNIIIFLISWSVKIFATGILKKANRSGKITKGKCYLIYYSQKIHMIAFNLIALDLIIYGIRTVFHSENLNFVKVSISFVLLSLLIIDYCEIWILGSDTLLKDAELEEMKKGDPELEEMKKGKDLNNES